MPSPSRETVEAVAKWLAEFVGWLPIDMGKRATPWDECTEVQRDWYRSRAERLLESTGLARMLEDLERELQDARQWIGVAAAELGAEDIEQVQAAYRSQRQGGADG